MNATVHPPTKNTLLAATVLMLAVAALLLSSGCSRNNPASELALSSDQQDPLGVNQFLKAFAKAEDKVKFSANDVAMLLRSGDYATASTMLQRYAANQTLTQEQRQAATDMLTRLQNVPKATSK
jgi:hypothetical protein